MKNKKGGSIASDRVNSLSPKSCNTTIKYPITDNKNINRCFAVNNYSTVYKTTGGKTKNKFNKNKTKNTKKGGRVLMPARYFNPRQYGNYTKKNIPEYVNEGGIKSKKFIQSGGINKKNKNKKGGNLKAGIDGYLTNTFINNTDVTGSWWPLGRSVWGDSILSGAQIPVSLPQKAQNYIHGETQILEDKRGDPSNPMLQLKCTDNTQCYQQHALQKNSNITDVNGFNQFGIPDNKGLIFKDNVDPTLKADFFDIPTMKAGGKNKKKGGGSDWISTHNSRGSYTASNMSETQFNRFSKTAPYSSNIDLAQGTAKYFKSPPLIISNELKTPGNIELKSYNDLEGLPIKQFGKGKIKKNRII